MTFKVAVSGGLLFGLLAGANAGILTGNMTVDDKFEAYLSTSSTSLGTLIGNGDAWSVTSSITSGTLAAGTTYWLNIKATDNSQPGGFLGDFSLSGSDHLFGNGSTFLETSASYWGASETGIGLGNVTPTQYGTNGVGPWGTRPGISPNAKWIWTTNYGNTVYFQTQITPTSVPEPTSIATLGLGGLALLKRRRKSA